MVDEARWFLDLGIVTVAIATFIRVRFVRRPRCSLLPVEQGEDWMDRLQPGADWRLRVKVHGCGMEAVIVELRLVAVEERDADERRIGVRTSDPIRLSPTGFGTPVEQWVTIVRPRESVTGFGPVRRLRIVGKVYAARRRRIGRSVSFDLDMRSSGSFRGEQVISDQRLPLLGVGGSR